MDIPKDEMRQIIEGSSQIARIVTNYYFELKQCGMEHDEAFKMAMAYQTSILQGSINETD